MSKNPFSLVRAADFSDEQIIELWVEVGHAQVEQIIEPKEPLSKFILGGKGAGKTHLLRYHSYEVSRIRGAAKDAIRCVLDDGYLAVFLRATGVDAARFEATAEIEPKWQQLFGIYLELRLAELVLDALLDMQGSSSQKYFLDPSGFIAEISTSIAEIADAQVDTLERLAAWVRRERRAIDDAVNNYAFTGQLHVEAKFALGGLAIGLGRALPAYCADLKGVPLLYLVDEVENFTANQQKVINTLIRYSEGHVSFRISGRLYSMKTQATIGDEENREGSDYKTTSLDEIMREWTGYSKFAHEFIARRLKVASVDSDGEPYATVPKMFESVDNQRFYASGIDKFASAEVGLQAGERLRNMLRESPGLNESANAVVALLVGNFPPLIQKLNILMFCKKRRRNWVGAAAIQCAEAIRDEANRYVRSSGTLKGRYHNAYGHWAVDLFAQCCKEAGKSHRVPYAGFKTFVQMSCNNPRNLLIILGRAYAISAFRGVDIMRGERLSVELQSAASVEAAHFLYESDSNFGSPSERAKLAISRLGDLLRTARYSMNIPEVSPLAVSFSEEGLTDTSRYELQQALNYSLIFEVADGRPDRNSHRLHRKIHLNPLLAPKWQLPVATRGDISLPAPIINAIFDHTLSKGFDSALRSLASKWNDPFDTGAAKAQEALFQ